MKLLSPATTHNVSPAQAGATPVSDQAATGKRTPRSAGRHAYLNPSLPTTSSCYVAPSLVDRAPLGSLLMREETFGPALGIAVFDDDGEVVKSANDSPYGLTASV